VKHGSDESTAAGAPVNSEPLCDCGRPATHREYWRGGFRAWCEEHTPWSGHHEYCPSPCRELMCPHDLDLEGSSGGLSARLRDWGAVLGTDDDGTNLSPEQLRQLARWCERAANTLEFRISSRTEEQK
jgi:hypothetical protein